MVYNGHIITFYVKAANTLLLAPFTAELLS